MTPGEVPQITDYVVRIEALLLSQYARSVRLKGLIGAGSTEAQEVEGAFFEVREGFKLSQAIGAQLDALGRVYRTNREGRTDADFRDAIRLKASTGVSGTPDEMIAYIKNFVPGAPTDLEYIPEYPAKFVIATADETFGAGILPSIKAAGVQGLFASPLTLYDGSALAAYDGSPLLIVRS